MTNFVHLHVHSDYSLADASVSISSLVKRAKELEMTHIALTDHGNMFGAMEFIEACKKNKNAVKPIIGCEVYVSPGSRFEKKGAEHENKYYHMVLLAQTREGYFNLVKICSYAYTEGFYYRPRIDNEILSHHHGGLIALSACASGEIPRLIQAGKIDEAENRAVFYRDLFGKDESGEPCFYLEVQDHGIPSGVLRGSNLSQKGINDAVAVLSRKTGIPLAATNDVHYLNRDDNVAHDILLCIGTARTRTEENRKKYFGDQFYFKTGDEMASILGEYSGAIENTVRIANRCNADIPSIEVKDLPKYLPKFDIPQGFGSAEDYLRHITIEGLPKRYPNETAANGIEWENIKKRANYELDTIIGMGFTGYFLIVADFIRYANDNDIPVGPGRGSGAGSIVAYSLRITDIDPLKYNLLFERFLNPDRISMPDFDIDFANYGRDDVIKYVTEKYGKERVGQIITFGTLGAKQVIKDVARTLGISIPESDMITKLIPRGADVTLENSINNEPKLKELEQDSRYVELFQLARKLEGLNRHSSLHAAGVVIGKSPLMELVPLYQERDDSKTGKPGAVATQFSMNYLEPCGLVKMDFLGLKTLDVIKHAETLVRQRGGSYSNFSVKKEPEDNSKTFKMLGEGNSYGIFQFESDGMRDILKQTKPNSIADLTALNAMYRPGPMQNIPRFVDSKNGKQEITYPDKSLEEVLKETYGVIVYQEQVMEVAKIIAGYSMGKADLLRRAMGKKKKEIIDEEKIPFLEGAVKQGFSKEKAGAIYDILVPFAGYGFNKSHAAAYSVVAYHTAYLKANFPAEFMAANLTNDIHSADKDRLSHCIDEARKMSLEVEPPNINKSDKLFTVVDGRVIFGFLGIKGVGEAPAEEIVRCRKEGLYKSFIDFLDRVDIKAVGKKVIELLVQTGAFDSFGITRETLQGNLEKAVEYALKKKEDKQFGQTSLFEDAGEEDMPDYKFEDFPPMSRSDRLNLEKQLIGFYFSGHPMDEYKQIWQDAVKVNLGQLESLKPGNCVLVGIIKNIKTITTAKGSKMAFASLSDYNGEIEITFFSGPWERVMNIIKPDNVAILRGKIDYQKDKDKYSFIAENVVSRQEVDTVIKEIKEQNQKDKVHRNTWMYMADLKSSYINKAKKGSYTIIGYLTSLRDFQDKNGNDMAFGALQDFDGEIDLVFFSKVYTECRHLLKLNEIIALKGSIDPENERNPEKISFKVTSIADFPQLSRSAVRKEAANETMPEPELEKIKEKVMEKTPEDIHIKLKEGAAANMDELNQLRDFLAENSGSSTIYIHIPLPKGEKLIRTSSGLELNGNDDAFSGLSGCKCVEQVWRV
ncbi:MAG: DNA polymerase III subunit alpha [Treponema sp.]|nr:DNA polymerase III subunit alpha [Treponema sp.]